MKRIGDILTRNKTPVMVKDGTPSTNSASYASPGQRPGNTPQERTRAESPTQSQRMPFETIQLGEVLRHRKGSITIDDATTYKLCRVQVHRRGVILRQKILGAEISTKNQQVCKAGDFLVAEMDAKVGGYGFVPPELDGAIVSSHYFLFEVDETRLHPPYLTVISQTQILQHQIVSKGSTNYASIRPAQVLSWQIPLPDLAEQKRIASLYQTVQAKLALATTEFEHQETLLAKLQQAILQEAIQGKLTAEWRAAHPQAEPASQLLHRIQAEKARLIAAKQLRPEKPLPKITPEEIPFEIPKTWEWCRYGSLCEYITSGSRGWQQYYADSGALFIRAQNIKTDKINLEDEAFVNLPNKSEGKRAQVQRNDILITITGGNLGKTALVEDDFDEAYVSQHVALTRLVDTDLAKWAHQSLITDAGPRGQLLGYSRGDKPGLNLPNVRHVPIPLPPLAEQTAIMARVETLLGSSRLLAAEIAHTRTHAAHLLQAVLKEAFTPAK
jgi:type I restriction enzyme S subunit